ncbi:MAG: HAD-IB family phosphatase [Chitinophagaceae bacterium]|nr:HAD-IB family phosphatase [Chitinophagaceae bacterium]
MITVIIPALNEEKTIRHVIGIAKKSALVSEIIVIDDQSTDQTVEEAAKEQVTIYTSSVRGKGTSMREGIMLAAQPVIVFLDADITTYPDDVVERLALPILNGDADFVKSYFERQAGRVTELVAKPLLSFLFPSISNFKQPLSGMIGGRKELLEKISIEDDYGVDIGILIDMHKEGARIEEVSLGYIENRMQGIVQLGVMSKEVTLAILKRSGRFFGSTFETITGIHFNTEDPQLAHAVKDSVKGLKKLAIFDMDNTILRASFIRTMAAKFGFETELLEIINESQSSFIRIKQVAQLLRGISITSILKTMDEIPVVEDAKEVVASLKHKGYICGIISESYDVTTRHIANKLGMHFSLANELELHNSIATGEVKIPSFFLKNKHSICKHDYCKSNAVTELTKRYGIELKNVIAIGNGKNDICMIKHAGTGVAFCPEHKTVEKASRYQIHTPQLASLLTMLL